jgi:hypothetical protein
MALRAVEPELPVMDVDDLLAEQRLAVRAEMCG